MTLSFYFRRLFGKEPPEAKIFMISSFGIYFLKNFGPIPRAVPHVGMAELHGLLSISIGVVEIGEFLNIFLPVVEIGEWSR